MQNNLAYVEQNKFQYASSREYLSFLYQSLDGYIFRCQKKFTDGEEKFISEYFSSKKLPYQQYAGQKDTYVSMNSFYYSKDSKKPERKVCCLKRLNALYVDIDCYKEGMRNDIVLKDLEDRVFGKELPYPTFVINSGRGLYLIWKFKKSEDRNALPRWERTQVYLINALGHYGADPACKDAARVLRVPNSVNSKSKTDVKVMRYYGNEYTLYGIMKELEIDYSFVKHPKQQRKASDKQIAYATVLASKAGVELPNFDSRFDTYKFIEKYQDVAPYVKSNNNISYFDKESPKVLLKGYLSDLYTLFSMRDKPDCKREIALFLCRYWNYELYKDDELALKETLKLNASFAYPFNENYVIQNTKSAVRRIESGLKYNYKKTTLIEILDITKDEMLNLRHLKVRTIEEERQIKKERNHNSYVMRLIKNGKTTKSMKIEERLLKLQELISEGFTVPEILDKLNISKATYYRMYAKLNESIESGENEIEIHKEDDVDVSKEIDKDISGNINHDNLTAKNTLNSVVLFVKNLIKCVVSFFKLPFWERALALHRVRDDIYIKSIYKNIIDYNIYKYDKGYERMDDCKGHDTA